MTLFEDTELFTAGKGGRKLFDLPDTDLMLVDEEETMFLNDELLKGLDEELDAFLKDLMEK